MGYTKTLRELFSQTFTSNVTVTQTVNFLDVNGYFKDVEDEDTAREMFSAYKRQEARRFLGGIKDDGRRLYANYRDGGQNYYTQINNGTVSEYLHKAETAMFAHISGTRRNCDNIKAKRMKAQVAERRLDRAARRTAKRRNIHIA